MSGITKVVILGHSGFIGRYVSGAFQKVRGVEVIEKSSKDTDLTDWKQVQRLNGLMDSETAVVMCAGLKKHRGDSLDNYEQNMRMILNLSRLLQTRRVKKLVYLSSVAVYGEERNDTCISERTPLNPSTYYADAKCAGEFLLQKLKHDGFIESLAILRPSIVYGPGDEGENYRPAEFMRSIQENRRVNVWGDALELRDFVFVRDVAEFVRLVTMGEFGGTLNLASGQSYSFLRILEIIQSVLSCDFETVSIPRTRPKVDQGFDIRKLQSSFPDFKFTNFMSGIRDTYHTILETEPRISK